MGWYSWSSSSPSFIHTPLPFLPCSSHMGLHSHSHMGHLVCLALPRTCIYTSLAALLPSPLFILRNQSLPPLLALSLYLVPPLQPLHLLSPFFYVSFSIFNALLSAALCIFCAQWVSCMLFAFYFYFILMSSSFLTFCMHFLCPFFLCLHMHALCHPFSMSMSSCLHVCLQSVHASSSLTQWRDNYDRELGSSLQQHVYKPLLLNFPSVWGRVGGDIIIYVFLCTYGLSPFLSFQPLYMYILYLYMFLFAHTFIPFPIQTETSKPVSLSLYISYMLSE